MDELLSWARHSTMTDSQSHRLLRIFLCHASRDKEQVRELYRRLSNDGFGPWLDEEHLLPGQNWRQEIPKAVRDSDIVLVCLSRNSISKSGYVQKEINLALHSAEEQPEGTIYIIPVRLEECEIPERLSGWQWVNLFEERGYQKLTQSLRHRTNSLGEISPSSAQVLSKRAGSPQSLTEKPSPLAISTLDLDRTPVDNSKTPAQKKLLPIYIVGTMLVVAVIGGALALWRPWRTNETNSNTAPSSTRVVSERAFTYYLTPSDRGKSIEEKRFTGNEQFRNGSKFIFVLIPEQLGALYLIDIGAGQDRVEAWYVLFPTPKNNQGSSQVNAGQQLEARIQFDKNPGSENLSVIWSKQPIPELEAICKDAAKTGFEIKDPAQIATVKQILTNHASQEAKVEIDTKKNQTTVRSGGDILIQTIVLKHIDF